MFHKPFRVKTQSTVKGSDRKKLRAEFLHQYPSVNVDTIFSNKDEMTVAKICTHGGDDIIVYLIDKNPMLFEAFRVIYPTVYFLWKYPDIIPTFTTWPEVFKKLEGGADLMLPGVIVPRGEVGRNTLGHFDRGQGCAINLRGNRAAVAVGRTLLSNVEMHEAAMRGKGVAVLHTYRDQLWQFGNRSELPVIADSPTTVDQQMPTLLDGGSTSPIDSKTTADASASLGSALSALHVTSITQSRGAESADIGLEMDDPRLVSFLPDDALRLDAAEFGGNVERDAASAGGDDCGETADDFTLQESGKTADTVPVSKGWTVLLLGNCMRKAIDALLYECFLYALKTTAKKAEFPLLTSNFFRNHMARCCPKGSSLDVKKSSYKKLSKFLSTMQQRGFIQVKELTKGVESIISINTEHDELRHFRIPDWELSTADEEGNVQENTEQRFSYTPPTITDMYQVTSAVQPLLKGHRKGDALLSQDVRQLVTDFVKSSELQHPDNRSLVRLDTTLSDAVVSRGEYIETLRWDDLVDRCLSKMTAVHRVTFAGSEPRIVRGHIEPIGLDVQQRGANKKVTLVCNLETYGIDPQQFASLVQKGVACSTSVGPQTGKPKCSQVTVQGNQINFIAQLLRDKYQLPTKYIRGLEKAPKAPKKKA